MCSSDLFDGASTPQSTSLNYLTSTAFLPSSQHSVQLAYVLADGRRSPLSAAASGKTWGEDLNGDEVEAYLLANGLVTPNAKLPDAPTNQPCAHEMPGGAPMAFNR